MYKLRKVSIISYVDESLVIIKYRETDGYFVTFQMNVTYV